MKNIFTEKKSPLTISGSIDAYYRYNFHNAKDSSRTNNFTSFTNSKNSFELGMASLKADKKGVAGFGKALYDLTLSAGIHIDNLTIVPEFRLDGAKDPIFIKIPINFCQQQKLPALLF